MEKNRRKVKVNYDYEGEKDEIMFRTSSAAEVLRGRRERTVRKGKYELLKNKGRRILLGEGIDGLY